ncbi:MAG: hypothetical protein WD688_22515 [Candidatus Binatia bacterium]
MRLRDPLVRNSRHTFATRTLLVSSPAPHSAGRYWCARSHDAGDELNPVLAMTAIFGVSIILSDIFNRFQYASGQIYGSGAP